MEHECTACVCGYVSVGRGSQKGSPTLAAHLFQLLRSYGLTKLEQVETFIACVLFLYPLSVQFHNRQPHIYLSPNTEKKDNPCTTTHLTYCTDQIKPPLLIPFIFHHSYLISFSATLFSLHLSFSITPTNLYLAGAPASKGNMVQSKKFRGVRQRQWGSWVSEIRHPLL